MVQCTHPIRPVEQPSGLVTHEGVVCPAVPQALHDLLEFPGARIALGMRDVHLPTKVAGFGGRIGRNQVPASTATGQMIQRGELACYVVRLVVAGGGGGDQADALGDRAQRRQQGQWLEVGRACAVAGQGVGGCGNAIRDEQRVEAGRFGDLRGTAVAAEIHGVGRYIRVAPGGHMVPGGHEEGAQA
ncbi:hypothetical protein D3C81_1685740 [compost metagenome]